MNAVRKEIRILLVEDSDTDAMLIDSALCDVPDFHPQVFRADLLAAGVAYARATQCDVALLDLGLPDAQGLDTFRRFHQLVPHVPVLVLTGLSDISVGLQAIQEGAQDYLLKKDVQASLLGRAIHYAMERHRVAQALELSREDLRRLSGHVQHVREEEKSRIARELHDDLGQQLVALKMVVALVEQELSGAAPPSPRHALQGVYTLIDQMVESVRRIAADLRPVMLDDLGLIPAVEWLVNEFSRLQKVQIFAHVDLGGIDFNRESANAVYRIVQEALTNVARHSAATVVKVDLVRQDPHCVVRIADNGRGIASEALVRRNALGLLGLRERVARLGGDLQIVTAKGAGFTLTATLPLAAVQATA